jgi:hypothetical protein
MTLRARPTLTYSQSVENAGLGLRARLLHRLDQDLSTVCRIAYRSQECYAGTTHAILGFHMHMKPKAIDRCHCCFLRLDVSKFPGKPDERSLWSAFMC